MTTNEMERHGLGLHLRLSLVVPASVPRPLPTEMEMVVNLPPDADITEIERVIAGTAGLLDSYAQAVCAKGPAGWQKAPPGESGSGQEAATLGGDGN